VETLVAHTRPRATASIMIASGRTGQEIAAAPALSTASEV
jgi:hypothetical protein